MTELPVLAAERGLADGRVARRFNCFDDTSAEAKVAKDLFIQSVSLQARNPTEGAARRQAFLF